MTIATMQKMLQDHDLCVMATEAGGKPHCSLMAYVCDEDCRHMYMATYKNSTKWRNLSENPSVSCLVDTRERHGRDRRTEVQALTVTGVCEPVGNGVEEERVRGRLLAAHPQLKVFLGDPDCGIIAVRILSFLLLDGLTHARYVEA